MNTTTWSEATSSLFDAVEQRDATAVNAAIDAGADCGAADLAGHVPLDLAVKNQDFATVNLLVKRGGASVDPTRKCPCNTTPFNASLAPGSESIFELFCEHCSVQDYICPCCGGSLLHHVAQTSNITLLAKLLDLGIDPKKKQTTGCTALHRAVGFANFSAVELMLSKDKSLARIYCEGCHGTPLVKLARDIDKDASPDSLRGSAILATANLLIDAGEDLLPQYRDSLSALNWAAYSGYFPLVKLLTKRFPDHELVHRTSSCTPTESAIEGKHPEIAEWLAFHEQAEARGSENEKRSEFRSEALNTLRSLKADEKHVLESISNIGITYNQRDPDGLILPGSFNRRTPFDPSGIAYVSGINISPDSIELVGPPTKGESLPVIVAQDLATALALAFLEDDPTAVSFGLWTAGKRFDRMAFTPAWMAATLYGRTLFHADYLLKQICNGFCLQSNTSLWRSLPYRDPERHPTTLTMEERVSGSGRYQNRVYVPIWLEKVCKAGDDVPLLGSGGRITLLMGKVKARVQTAYSDSNIAIRTRQPLSVVFGSADLYVEGSQTRIRDDGTEDGDYLRATDQSNSHVFAQAFTKALPEIEKLFPDFARLRDLLKLTATFSKLRDAGMRLTTQEQSSLKKFIRSCQPPAHVEYAIKPFHRRGCNCDGGVNIHSAEVILELERPNSGFRTFFPDEERAAVLPSREDDAVRDSVIASANLEKSDGPRPANHEAAHIVPATHQHPDAIACREILSGAGIDRNEACNLLWAATPKNLRMEDFEVSRTSHPQTHTHYYFRKLRDTLEAAGSSSTAVRSELETVKYLLKNGGFF